MGSLPIARTLLSVLGTWSVVACERCGVEVNLPALGVCRSSKWGMYSKLRVTFH